MHLTARRTYLCLLSAPAPTALWLPPEVQVVRLPHGASLLYRRLYREVGRRYHWEDRCDWNDARIAAHLRDRRVAVYALRVRDAAVGFFELHREKPLPPLPCLLQPLPVSRAAVSLEYFGIMPPLHGRGLGKLLLQVAIDAAWSGPDGCTYLWLHTCTLDGPAALPNYLKRGFKVVGAEDYLHACRTPVMPALRAP